MSPLKLLSFPGLSTPGLIPLSGAEPGDQILDVVATNGDGHNYWSSFLKIVLPPSAGSGFPQISQTSSVDLSALKFVALITRRHGAAD